MNSSLEELKVLIGQFDQYTPPPSAHKLLLLKILDKIQTDTASGALTSQELDQIKRFIANLPRSPACIKSQFLELIANIWRLPTF